MAENKSFTFWVNMKEAIDVYDGQPEFQYKMYDALTNYAFYDIWPEDDGSMESKILIMFVQSMVPSLDKSKNYMANCAESGAKGGRKQKVEDEQLKDAIVHATLKVKRVPSRKEVVESLKEMYNIEIDTRTVSRRFNDEKKKEIAEGTLRQNEDKINVPETKGQNGDKINVPPALFQF